MSKLKDPSAEKAKRTAQNNDSKNQKSSNATKF